MNKRQKQAKAIAQVGAIAAVGTAAVLGAARWAYSYAFKPTKGRCSNPYQLIGAQSENYKEDIFDAIKKLEMLPCEWVYTQSEDCIRLAGRYYHQKDGAPLVIFFHGYRSPSLRDFSGGFWIYWEQGYNILIVDQRGHGESQGDTITMGIKERHDCVRWVEYAVERFGPEVKILLGGISMGAATVMMAAELLQDCPNVKCILADCGYSSVEGVMKEAIKCMKLPVGPSWKLVKLGAKLYGNFNPDEASAVESLRNSRIPVVFIHGEADDRVPAAMSAENAAACGADRIATFYVPDAEHGMSFFLDKEGYYETVVSFVKEMLEEETQDAMPIGGCADE